MTPLTPAQPVAPRVRAARTRTAPTWLAVTASVIAVLLLLPLFYLLLRASEVGIAGIIDLLFSVRTLQVTAASLLLAALVTGISLLIALPLAWLTTRTDLPAPRFFTILATLPLVFPSYVGAFALVAMMGPRGILQGWLEPLGVERLPSIYGLFGATWALTLFSYPYLLLSLRAGMMTMDPSLEEAARSLGYNGWHSFRRVTLPALRPAISAGSLLVALYVLSDFGAVSILRYPSFTRVIYVQYRSSFDRSLAAVLGLLLVAITLGLLFAAQRIQGKRRHDRASVGAARRTRLVQLGHWKFPAMAFCLTVAVAAFVLPAGVILYWLVRGLFAGESLLPMGWATVNSVSVSTAAAAVAILCALPVAYYSVRYRSRYSAAVSRLAYIGFGLPGIVVALSLVYFGANYAPLLYQTLPMLIFAYIVRFLPEGLGTLRTNLFQVSPRLEEAARSLGLAQPQAVGRVTLPLLRAGLWTGIALVFLSTVKELPVTLLLAPTGFTTLATQIWAATEEASYTRAAAPSLLLVLVSAVGLVIPLRQERDR